MKNRCLYCYKLLSAREADYHTSCSKDFFGQAVPPVLPYAEDQLEELAKEVIRRQTAVTGVQPKIALHLTGDEKGDRGATKRFTIVGLWGGYILKPPSTHYRELPEVEDLTMHLATIAKIRTVPHALIRMSSGNLAYITRRVDRDKMSKIHMEDMCQLTDRLTEQKYQGSYEQIAKAILKYSSFPGLDLVNYFEMVLFSFLTGNADMHLKNFSLIRWPKTGIALAPGYDMLATKLVNPLDTEELALTLNGKKRKLGKRDFDQMFDRFGLKEKQKANIYTRMAKSLPAWKECIDTSFLSAEFKEAYKALLTARFEKMY